MLHVLARSCVARAADCVIDPFVALRFAMLRDVQPLAPTLPQLGRARCGIVRHRRCPNPGTRYVSTPSAYSRRGFEKGRPTAVRRLVTNTPPTRFATFSCRSRSSGREAPNGTVQYRTAARRGQSPEFPDRFRCIRPSGCAPARSRRCRALTIENPTFSKDLYIARGKDFGPTPHLMAPLRHRAKKKGTQRER